MKELKIEKRFISDPEVPLRSYNYSYIADRLATKYAQKVSTPTIINRAKKAGFYLKNPKGRLVTERSLLTMWESSSSMTAPIISSAPMLPPNGTLSPLSTIAADTFFTIGLSKERRLGLM